MSLGNHRHSVARGRHCADHRANNMLTAAGFVAKYPDTPEKREIFNSLPPNRLVKRGRNGKIYYVYADPGGCGCAYVGSPNAYAN
jgi:hypothetical protein